MQTKLGPQVCTQQNLPLSPAPILCFLVCSLGDKAITINSRLFSAPQNSEPIQQSLPLPPLPHFQRTKKPFTFLDLQTVGGFCEWNQSFTGHCRMCQSFAWLNNALLHHPSVHGSLGCVHIWAINAIHSTGAYLAHRYLTSPLWGRSEDWYPSSCHSAEASLGF